jgi:hypothetical protein
MSIDGIEGSIPVVIGELFSLLDPDLGKYPDAMLPVALCYWRV